MPVQYVDFKNEYFDDFKDLILPNIYEECISSRVLSEDGLFCVGAVMDDLPVGAVIARLSSDRELDIASVYVQEEFRRQGIGSGLMNALLSASVELLDRSSPMENPNIGILVNCEYALPKVQAEEFKKFLTDNGFTMHTEYGKLLSLEPEAIRCLAEKCTDPAKTYKPDKELELLDDMLLNAGISMEEKICCYAGDPEDPEALAMVAYGFDGLQLISREILEAPSAESIRSLLAGVLTGVLREHPGETLLVNMDGNIEAFYEILKDWSEVCIHGQSMAALAFEAEEEEA